MSSIQQQNFEDMLIDAEEDLAIGYRPNNVKFIVTFYCFAKK